MALPNIKIHSTTANALTLTILSSGEQDVQYEVTLTPKSLILHVNASTMLVGGTQAGSAPTTTGMGRAYTGFTTTAMEDADLVVTLKGLLADVDYVVEVKTVRGCEQSRTILAAAQTKKNG